MLLTEKAAPHLEKTRGNVVVISSAVSIRTVGPFLKGPALDLLDLTEVLTVRLQCSQYFALVYSATSIVPYYGPYCRNLRYRERYG